MREKILASANALFSRNGYKDTKMEDIAKEANISLGSIYKNFSGKKEIFENLGKPELLKIMPSQDKRRSEIMEAALILFGTKGYSRTNMDDIAQQLGLSKAMIYKHFPSKEELFIAMVQDTTQMVMVQNMSIHSGKEDIRDKLEEIAFSFLELYKDPRRINLLRAIISETPTFPETGQLFYEKVIYRGAAYLSDFLSPYLKSGADPFLVSRLFFGMLWSLVITQEMIQTTGIKFDTDSIVKESVGLFTEGILHK